MHQNRVVFSCGEDGQIRAWDLKQMEQAEADSQEGYEPTIIYTNPAPITCLAATKQVKKKEVFFFAMPPPKKKVEILSEGS